MAIKKMRVLADVVINGVQYRSGNVVSIEQTIAKAYSDIASLDFTKEAVEYAESDGVLVRDHAAEVSELKADV